MKPIVLALPLMLLFSAQAQADVIGCRANSFVSWQGGQADPSSISESEAEDLFIDLDTGRLWRDGEEPTYYEVFRTGPMGGNTDFVAFSPEAAALVRVRLANQELQFMHDHDRTIEVGTCSFAPEGTNP